jgi:hypothetical protein
MYQSVASMVILGGNPSSKEAFIVGTIYYEAISSLLLTVEDRKWASLEKGTPPH